MEGRGKIWGSRKGIIGSRGKKYLADPVHKFDSCNSTMDAFGDISMAHIYIYTYWKFEWMEYLNLETFIYAFSIPPYRRLNLSLYHIKEFCSELIDLLWRHLFIPIWYDYYRASYDNFTSQFWNNHSYQGSIICLLLTFVRNLWNFKSFLFTSVGYV